MISDLIYISVLAVHLLAASAWLGGMLYSFFVLHPRARRFFGKLSMFEDFIVFVAAGARVKVLLSCSVIAVTGLFLIWIHRPSPPQGVYLLVKSAFFIVAVGVFIFVSWIAWPERILAAPDEIENFQKRFRNFSVVLIVLVTLCMILGLYGGHCGG